MLIWQKTDKNDATAIAIASQQANARFVALKSIDEQALQSSDRVRQIYQLTRISLSRGNSG